MATICIVTMPKTVIENRLLAMCWLYLPFNYCFPICEIPDPVGKKSVTIFWRLGFISEVQSSVKSTHIDFEMILIVFRFKFMRQTVAKG